MATSVILKACGGIGPYTWSKTGNVQLSATEGIEVTVTPTGSGGSTNFYITFSTGTLSCTTGTCATYAAGGAIGLSGAPNFTLRTTDCSGASLGGCSINVPNLTCGTTNVNCGDCTGTLQVTCVGSCTGAGGSCSASNMSDNIILTCGSNSGNLAHGSWQSGRQEYLIISGGGSVAGSTVTVTDHVGISVTYTF